MFKRLGIPVEIHCKICGVENSICWHRDDGKKWGNRPRSGFFCHHCYSCIDQKEKRGIVGLKHSNRRKGKYKYPLQTS